MSETKFTKEPWQSTGNTIYALRDGSNAFWAPVYVRRDVSDEEHQAVITLMKAAPQMHEALEETQKHIDMLYPLGKSGGDALCNLIDAALKAARGEQ